MRERVTRDCGATTRWRPKSAKLYRALPKKTPIGIWSQLFRYLSVGAVLQKFVGDGLPELLARFAQPKRSPTHYNRGMFPKIEVEKVVQTACENLSLNTGVDEYHHVAH